MSAAHFVLPSYCRFVVTHLPKRRGIIDSEMMGSNVVLNFCELRGSTRASFSPGHRNVLGEGIERVVNCIPSFGCTYYHFDSLKRQGLKNLRCPIEKEHEFSELSLCRLYGSKSTRIITSRCTKLRAKLRGDGDVDLYGETIAEDFYSVLVLTPTSVAYAFASEALKLFSNQTPDATPEEIKKAYYCCMKTCHPDLSGNDPAVSNFCMFINEVYEVLSDPEQRLVYDEINGYTLTAINPFKDIDAERDHAFVDEFTCIGCKNCGNTAPDTFEIEDEYGRARVHNQCGNQRLVQVAIETCPVDCIHWISSPQLALLEDEMRRMERVNVGLMLSGMGYQSPDVFAQASMRWDKRQARALDQARVRMMKEGGKTGREAWWKVNWNSTADQERSKSAADKYSRERAAKTAAATRRWREYSRRGVDRRAVRALASECVTNAEEEAARDKAGVK